VLYYIRALKHPCIVSCSIAVFDIAGLARRLSSVKRAQELNPDEYERSRGLA
jgi:hypothetical protein